MRAVRVHAYGKPPRIDEVPSPDAAGHGEIIVDVAAVGSGPWDGGVLSGRLAEHVKREPPFTMGAELAGRVSQVGAGVTGFAIGDRVYGNPGIVGAWAERVAIEADRCGHAPRSASDAQAAAIPVAGLTAWQALDMAELPDAAALLILGAGGSVGRAAVQLARRRVSHVVAVARSHQLDGALELGASAAYDSDSDWVSAIGSALPEGVHAIIDVVGGDALRRSTALVRRGGRIVTTRSEAAATPVPDGITLDFLPMRSRTADLEALAGIVDDGELSMPVGQTLQLDDAIGILDGSTPKPDRGKLVLML